MESMSGGLIFAKHSFSISEMEQMAFSPDLKHILRIVSVLDHEGKCQSDLYIYSIDKNPDYDSKNVRLIHHKQHFDLVRFIFSEDGKQLLISADGCIYNFCFDETGIHEGIVITLIELYQTSNIFKTDFVPYDIEPVHLKHNSITLCINRHWLLAFQLHLDSNHSLLYCVTITNDVLCLQYTKDKVYCLTSCAKIYSYNISDGSLSNIFDVYSVLPNNLHFDKFVVSTDNLKIAMYNSNNAVYIVDISSSSQCFAYAEGTSVYRSSERSGCESVKSYLTNVSRTSTYSRAESVHNINPTSSPTSWISNLEKLRLHYTVSQCPRNKSFVCIKDLPENMFVKTIQFYSYSSLGIWCQSRDIAADNIYRVYDSNTGQLEITEPLHPGTRVIPLNFSGINLDVFAEPGTLSLPLLFTSKEVFINKLLNCVGSDCVVWLLELDKSLSQSMQPLSLLKDALKDSQLHLVKLSLNLQLQELKRVLTKMSSEIMDVTGTTKTVMDQMITVVQDPATKESFNHQILMEALIYANKILSLLQTTNKDNLPSSLLNNLKIEILKRVVYLRSGLRRHQPSPIENPIRVPQWSMWEVLSDKEVVKEGVKELPLVHCFLIQQRHWSSHDITGGKFKQLVVSIVIDYLQKEQLKKAEEFLIRNGYDIAVELPLICSNTLNRSLRDYLIPALGEEYVNAWMFIKIIESILDRYTIPNPYIDYPQGPNAKLTLLNIMSYSSELKTQIITDLYFITRDSTLLKHLDRDICWDYLLSYNSVEGLLVWIDRRQSPLWPVSLFLQWSISQDMIDHILVCDVTDYTKETVLNRLASYGMFLSSEKNSSEAMIRRMANGRLLLQYKEVLKKSTANFCCEDLDKIILKYAVQKDLLDVVIVSGPQTLVIEEEYVQVEGRPDWFSVWKLCCQVSTNWDKETIIKLLTGTSDYLAGGDTSTYLKEHPFVAIAINLLKEKDISRVHAYFSPIIAAMTATEPLLKDATVYSLLAGTIPFYTDNLFQFQPDQHRIHKDSALEMPDFTNEELSKKYGHNQSLRFMDRLKQGRPSQAVIQLFDKNGRIAPQIKKYACYTAHGISLFNTTNPLIGSSCIAFIEMLGKDSELLRTHLACALIMQENSNRNIKSQLYKIVVNQVGAIEELLREIEETLEAQWKDESNMLLCLQQNQLPIRLTALHSLPPSNMILKYAAKSNNWLLFILAAHIFQYPLEKVQELVAEFNCRKLREHLYFAFAIEPVEQCDMDNIIIGNLKMSKVNAGPNSCHLQYEFELFANVAQCNNNAEEMLQISRRVGNPVLALLASSLKPKSVISPFCTWLVVSICGKNLPVTFDEPYTPAKVLEILELTIRLGYIRILAQAFLIYLPENPLQIFSTFLVDTVVDKKFQTSILTLKAFKAACLNLPDKTTGRIIGFMKNRSWIANASLRMASIALAYCFKSPYHQNRFLKVLVDSQFSQHLSVPAPDYYLFTRLSNCLAHTDIRLDYAQLCIQDNQSHLIEQLQLLIERKDFQTAFRFASTAGLSLGVVHIADWSNRAKTDEGRKPGFWSHCLTSLQQALVEPQLAAEFFRNQGSLLVNPQDRFLVLKCALEWMKKISVSVGDEENNVQLDLYLTALQEGFNIQMITEGMTYKPLHYLSTDIQRKSHLSQGVPKLSMEQHYKLDSLIHRLLEVGDIMTVVNLQDMFEHVNQDYELVLACMGLAEGKTFQQLPEMIQDLLNIDSNLSLSNRPKLPASSPRYNKQNSPVINIEEQQRVLNSLYALQVHQTCPTSMFRNIINAYKVATALGLDYKVVITHTEPLSFLHVEDDFEMAGYVFSLAALTKTEFAQYLAEQLISVIHAGPVDGSYMLWGCDLDTQFLRLLDLDGIIPLMLGNLLLSSVPRLDSKQLTTLREAVELIIRSHDCFTKACNMEGISSILTMSGDLVNFLLDCCQWALMVRLLTGVGRYTEMNYIFQILKDRDQFEFLLGKGLDKYPGLMSSMLDFVRYDKPRYMLVAVHFRMYSELAVMFKDEAMNELEKLERGQDGSLVRSDHNKQCLQAAMNKYADATNHYMQANKKKQGVLCIQQAELVALQLCLMITIPPIQNVHCLINLSPDQVTALILSFLSYEQACIVSAAYNLTIDWSAPLYYHCVVQGETSYLNAWGQHNHFTVTIVQDVARRFQNSKTVSLSMETNMKWFLSSVEQVDIKYRICSQLGFKDLLQTILSGPDVAYLKDTVWQRGFKYQHL